MTSVFYYEPFYDVDRLLEEVFKPRQGQVSRPQNPEATKNMAAKALKPRMDLHEDSEKNLVTAHFEFPGVSKENIQIDVQNGKLTVAAETKQSEEHDESGYAVKERRYGKISRTLQLPQGIDEDEIKAHMENGLLTITFPKSTPELAPKRVAVN